MCALSSLVLTCAFEGLQDVSDATIETLKAIEHPVAKTARILVEVCSFAGTGNVLKVQAMLHHCGEHIDMSKDKEKDKGKEKESDNKEEGANEDGKESAKDAKQDDTFQAFAVLGIALLAMGEGIGAEMSLGLFNHLVRGQT